MHCLANVAFGADGGSAEATLVYIIVINLESVSVLIAIFS